VHGGFLCIDCWRGRSLLIFVDGKVAEHGVVTETSPEGIKKETALSSFFIDAPVVWSRSPPGFDKVVFDVWAEHFAAFARSYYPQEDEHLCLDGAKIHLSPAGFLTLMRANVHVIAEPSQMSNILQALDNKSAFGRYQPKLRSQVHEITTECREAGRQFNTPELMRCIVRRSVTWPPHSWNQIPRKYAPLTHISKCSVGDPLVITLWLTNHNRNPNTSLGFVTPPSGPLLKGLILCKLNLDYRLMLLRAPDPGAPRGLSRSTLPPPLLKAVFEALAVFRVMGPVGPEGRNFQRSFEGV